MRILRVVGSVRLTCGCLVGRYETFAGPIISVIDARSHRCCDASHQVGTVLGPEERRDERPVVEGRPRAPASSGSR